MNEVGLWNSLQPLLQKMGLHPVRVENGLGEGTPDVSYAHGWIELKHLAEWPRRRDTGVRFDWQRGQKAWLAARWQARGLCWLWARVGGDVLLFDGWTAAWLSDEETQDELRALAIWPQGPYGPDASRAHHLRLLITGHGSELAPRHRLRWYRAIARMDLEKAASDLGVGVRDLVRAETGVSSQEAAEALLEAWEC